MKNDRLIDLGLTGYEELFMSTEERLDAKKPKVEAIPLADLMPCLLYTSAAVRRKLSFLSWFIAEVW